MSPNLSGTRPHTPNNTVTFSNPSQTISFPPLFCHHLTYLIFRMQLESPPQRPPSPFTMGLHSPLSCSTDHGCHSLPQGTGGSTRQNCVCVLTMCCQSKHSGELVLNGKRMLNAEMLKSNPGLRMTYFYSSNNSYVISALKI